MSERAARTPKDRFPKHSKPFSPEWNTPKIEMPIGRRRVLETAIGTMSATAGAAGGVIAAAEQLIPSQIHATIGEVYLDTATISAFVGSIVAGLIGFGLTKLAVDHYNKGVRPYNEKIVNAMRQFDPDITIPPGLLIPRDLQ